MTRGLAMRVEVLSDHGGQQLRRTEQQLSAAAQETAAWYGSYQQASADLDAAKRDKSLWKRVFAVSTAEEAQARARVQGSWQQALRADYTRQAVFGRHQQQAAGVQGEDILAWSLSVLPDDWTMLRGYRNRRGETDHVLIGPHGVWAVEVKRRRVRLHIDGDQWWFEKLDRRGRAVDTDWAVDGGGRSWARQVSDIAFDLSAWLRRNGHGVPVRTAVMLMHEGAQLGQIANLTVSAVGTHPDHMLAAIAHYPVPNPPPDCAAIVSLIRRDHAYHQNRRRR